MEQNVGKTTFKLPGTDPKKLKALGGNVIVLAVLAAIGIATYIYLLPYLLSLAWNTVQLCVAIVIGGFLGYILLNPKFWRGLKYITEAIASGVLSLGIEMNPFNILDLQIEQAEKDREELHDQTEKLKGQQAKLSNSLHEKDGIMRQAAKELEILKDRLAKNPNDDESADLLETSSTKYTTSKTFIDSVKPIANDIDKLVAFGDKAYKKSGIALQNAKMNVRMQRETYDAVTTGANAMSKARKAFTGNTDLNNDADKALEALRNDVANKIGTIKQAIQVTSDAMNKQDLGDAAKISTAVDMAEKLNIDKTFDYSASIQSSASGMESVKITAGNKFSGFLDSRK